MKFKKILKYSLLSLISIYILFVGFLYFQPFFIGEKGHDALRSSLINSMDGNQGYLKQFKKSSYYERFMKTKTADSILYYYREFDKFYKKQVVKK